MRAVILLLLTLVPGFVSPVTAQDSGDRAAEILRKLDAAIQEESAKSRAAILDLVRQELRGTKAKAPAPAPEAKPAAAAGAT